jgi:hypothetical protein
MGFCFNRTMVGVVGMWGLVPGLWVNGDSAQGKAGSETALFRKMGCTKKNIQQLMFPKQSPVQALIGHSVAKPPPLWGMWQW